MASILDLFNTPIRGLIAWNLLIHKELTASELSTLLNKSIATISRYLKAMEEEGLITPSKIEFVKNLKLNYWQITPSILEDYWALDRGLQTLQKEKKFGEISKFLGALKGIFNAILTYKGEKLLQKQDSEGLDELSGNGLISVILLDKEMGKIFDVEFKKFIQDFFTKYTPEKLGFDNLDLDSFIFFFLSSRVRECSINIKD
ncbi:MAG: ArsR/SmtB family transcription factor [Promethearchaeota archaeon]